MIQTVLKVLSTATVLTAVYLLQTNQIVAAVVAVIVGVFVVLVAARLAPSFTPPEG